MDNISLILTLSLLIWISPFIAKIVKLPIPPIEIILGSLVVYFGIIQDNNYFNLIAQVGFLYLMFLAGLEVNLKKIKESPKIVIQKSILFLVSMLLFSTILGFIFKLNFIIIISMPLISIGLLATLSKTYKNTSWIELAFIAGVLGEIISITALTVFDVASSTGFSFELFLHLGYLLFFLIGIYFLYRFLQLLFWWMPEIKQILLPKNDTSSQDIRLSMALFFILIVVMLYLELELALGSFIAGVGISIFFHKEEELEEKLSSLGFGFLVPLFFIHVGSSFKFDALFIDGVIEGALIITFIMILSRVLGAFVLKEINGSKDAILVALSLSMPLTLLVAVATIGNEMELINLLEYYQLILASIFEIIISMTTIKIIQIKITTKNNQYKT